MKTLKKADMGGILLRAHLAKMISIYATTIGGLTPNTAIRCNFVDIAKETTEMK